MMNVPPNQPGKLVTPRVSGPTAERKVPEPALTGQRLGSFDRLLIKLHLAPAGESEVLEKPLKGLNRFHELISRLFGSKPPTSPPGKPAGAGNAEVRVAKELPYHTDTSKKQAKTDYERLTEEVRDKLESKHQSQRADIAPGVMLQRNSNHGKYGIRQLREDSDFENKLAFEGLKKTDKGWSVPTIRNPEGADFPFDPFAHMPNVVFASTEDSFPVLPDLDKDGKTETDADSYKHGVIGGKQPLTAAFSVAKKGEYVVMTYSYYYVDNKFTNYHRTDSSTFSVYLKPGKDGRLKPEYLYNSWHYGGNMTRWEDLKKGPDGRPVVLVERGSHALHAFGKKEELPSKGLWINGDGTTSLDGRKLGSRMTLLSPQSNVAHVTRLDPANAGDARTLNSYFSAYPERRHPIHPVLFQKLGGLK